MHLPEPLKWIIIMSLFLSVNILSKDNYFSETLSLLKQQQFQNIENVMKKQRFSEN